MKTKTPARKNRSSTAAPVIVIDGVKVRLLRHPGKGKIPLKVWRDAVRAVNDMRAAGIDPATAE